MTDRTERRSRPRTLEFCGALVLVAALAACGGTSDDDPPTSAPAAADEALDALAALVAEPLSMDIDTITERVRDLNRILDRVDEVDGGPEAMEALVLGEDGAAAAPPLMLIADSEPVPATDALEAEVSRLAASDWPDRLVGWVADAPSGHALDVVAGVVVLSDIANLLIEDPTSPIAQIAIEASNEGNVGPGLELAEYLAGEPWQDDDHCRIGVGPPTAVGDVRATTGGGSGEVEVSWPASASTGCFELLRSATGGDEVASLTLILLGRGVIQQRPIDGASFQVQVADGRVVVIEHVGPDGLSCSEPCTVTYRVIALGADEDRSEPSAPACAAPPTVDAEQCG